jgi:hypothetical protein
MGGVSGWLGDIPVFVAVAVSEDDVVGEFFHEGFSCCVHETESAEVVRFVEPVSFGEAIKRLDASF